MAFPRLPSEVTASLLPSTRGWARQPPRSAQIQGEGTRVPSRGGRDVSHTAGGGGAWEMPRGRLWKMQSDTQPTSRFFSSTFRRAIALRSYRETCLGKAFWLFPSLKVQGRYRRHREQRRRPEKGFWALQMSVVEVWGAGPITYREEQGEGVSPTHRTHTRTPTHPPFHSS